MSGEVVRAYAPGTGRKRRRRGGRGGNLLLGLVAAGLLASLWMLYATRDAMPMHRVVPAGQAYRVLIPDLLRGRAALAASPVWRVAGEQGALAGVPARLSGDFGLPPWVANNTLHGLTHLSGNDTAAFSDWLCVVRMSRIGVLLERLHRFTGEVARDPAGGLALRALPRHGMHYAVRGRLLILSPSRDALIRALTLAPDAAAAPADLAPPGDRGGDDILHAFAELPPDAPGGAHIASVRISLRLPQDGIRLGVQAVPRAALREALPGLLAARDPGSLPAAADGALALSFNAGMPLPRAWDELRTAFPALPAPPGASADDGDPLAALLRAAWNGIGATGWISWVGVAPLATLPVPELVGGLAADAAVGALLANVPADAPVPPDGIDLTPRRDPETGVAYVDLLGGPDISPCAVADGGRMLAGSSRNALARVAAAPPAGNLPQPGLAYARLRPEALAADLAALGRELAAIGMIAGLDPPAYEAAAAGWIRRAAAVREIAALLHNPTHDGLRLDIEARFATAD